MPNLIYASEQYPNVEDDHRARRRGVQDRRALAAHRAAQPRTGEELQWCSRWSPTPPQRRTRSAGTGQPNIESPAIRSFL
jgi:hypothetical protein